jgi:dTDP-glucose 4,6-dehydratase
MDKVMITGGTGFVGYWLNKCAPPDVAVFPLSRLDYQGQLYTDWKYIIHLAPIAPTRILDIARKCGARVLYASSGIVYHPENNTQYRQDKIAGEKECLDSGVDVVIARLFTFLGKRLDKYKAITTFIEAAKRGEPLYISGDGTTTRSYMHGLEMARWMWAILFHGERGQAYDVGADVPITMEQLAIKIIEKYNSKSEIIIEGGRDPMPHYLPEDTKKTRELLDKMK